MKGKPISCILAIVLILSICSAYALASSSDVIINEFLSHPHQQSENEWIEIYNNNGTSAVDLTGWTINDTLTPPKVIVTIADNTIIQPNSHLIFYTVKELNDGEDTIKLIDETGTVIDEYTYNSDIGINNSLGRLHDGLGQWEIFTKPTPNATNNRLPSGTIADQEINEDTLSNFTITSYITDPDEDIMVFSVVEKDTLKVDCKINDTNLTLNPAADWNGTASCKVEADDGYGKINRTFNIIVSNVNDQPYFDPVLEDKVIDEDLNFTYDINASDIDEGDSLTFESNITALGGSINDSGVLEWTPDNSHVGNNTIEVIVCDDSGAENNCISSSFIITVSNVNDQPYFDPVLEDKVIDEDLNFTYDINASDIDEGDSLTFESNITALGGSINDSGVLKWTPDNSHVGDNIIEVIVCDDSGAEDNCTSSSFTIEVENVNDAPVISPAIASLSFLEGRSVSVNLNDYVDDIDNTDEDITWAASGMSGLNVSIDPAEKMMEVSAPETWHGTERFNLTADDGALIEHNDTEEITVDVQSILSFSDLVVTIDGNDYSAGNNDLVGPASPDSSLSISLKLKNNYPEANEWVEEIVISARLDSSIDDETETSLPVSLDGSKSISRQLTFQNLPLDIVEGEYELTIRASGNDYDGVSREVEWVVYIDYLTENNEVRILDVSLEEDELSCYRESAINVSLVNTGETKQHVNLTVSNDDLGIYESEIIPIVARDTIIKEYGIELFDPVDAGDYPIDVKIGYYDGEGGYLTFEEQAILDVKKCFDVEGQNIDEDSPEDITIDLGDYVDDSLKDDSEFIYSIENETNTDLIGCEIAVGGQDLICSAPTADKNGYSDINISVVSESGLYTNYDVFRLTVNPVNDAPEAYGIEEEVDEDGSVMIDLNCTDIDDSSLAYEIISQPGHGTLSKNGSSVLYKPEADFHGMDPFTYSCNDGDLKSNEANVEITVHSVPDEPSIVDASPEDASPEDRILIGDGVPQEFSITIDDPDSISPSISWYVGGEIQAEIGTEFTYESDENFTVKVNISHSATDHEHTWNVEVSDVPVTSYKGTIHDVNESNIDSFEGLTAYNSYGMIDFGDRAIDLSNAVDVDRYFNITNGAVGIDSDADGFDVFQVPATITMYNLPYESVPSIYYNDGFEISGTEECTGSTDPSCTNIKYNSTTGTLEFYVSHFSMFFLNIVPPTADAGADQDVAVGQKVVLDGSASYDADGTIVSYSWTQIEGSSVAVNESSSASVGFTPSSAGKYVFRLTVTDDDSLKGTDEIEVNAEELPPMPPASETGNLTISDLDVKIGGDKDKDLQDNDKISEEAGPGDRIEFDIELENLFSSSSDIEIEDIEITVTIKDIDDGDDLEEEAEIESLDADDTDSVSLEFDVPYIVDEGEYDVIIEAEGDDDTDDENSHEIRWELVLEVKKDKHDLIIKDLSLSPSLVRCNRDTVLEIEAVNIGREDEDDVSIEITNEDLGIEIIEEEIELEEGDTDDSVFEKSYRFRISDDVRPGVYPIQVEVNYGSNTGDHKELELTVQKCEDIVTPVKSEPVEVVPIIPTQAKPKEAAKEAAPEVSFMDTSNYVTLLAILFVLLLGGVIFLIGAAVILSKKR